jgi:hypothetical protein
MAASLPAISESSSEVPFVSWPRPAAAQTAGKGLAELLAPAPDRLIGSDNASFSQEQLDIP